MSNLMIQSRNYDLTVNVMNEAVYYVSSVINDLEDKMIYDKQYKTSSSIIYSANMLVDRVNYISTKNNKEKCKLLSSLVGGEEYISILA